MKDPFEQLSVRFDSYPWGGWSNPPVLSDGDKGPHLGGIRANSRAATCSESRAGLESINASPTRPLRGEGRCVPGKKPTAPGTDAGVVGAAREEGFLGNVGDPEREAGSRLATALQVSFSPGVGEAHSTVEAGESPVEGRGLTSGTLLAKMRTGRLA